MMNSQSKIVVASGAGLHEGSVRLLACGRGAGASAPKGVTVGGLPVHSTPGDGIHIQSLLPRGRESLRAAMLSARQRDGRDSKETMNLIFGNANAQRCAARAMMYRDDLAT